MLQDYTNTHTNTRDVFLCAHVCVMCVHKHTRVCMFIDHIEPFFRFLYFTKAVSYAKFGLHDAKIMRIKNITVLNKFFILKLLIICPLFTSVCND